MKLKERRKSLAHMLRSLAEWHAEDEVAARALGAAARRIDPDEQYDRDEQEDALVHDLPQPRYLHLLASIGGQESVEDDDEPETKIAMVLELGLYGGQADTLIDAVEDARAVDPESQWIRMTIEGQPRAEWKEPRGEHVCTRHGRSLAPMLNEAIRTAAPDDGFGGDE